MAVIRANRESIDDRFSVLGFTVRSELPLFEIGLATDPELLKPESRARRTPANFFTSRLLRAQPSQRGEAVYLVPPEIVARFVGQQRLYFGLATYRESDRSTPISLRMPDRGTMYVSLSGLSERGLRRTVRSRGASSYGGNGYGGNGGTGGELGWGGDNSATTPPPSRDEDRAARNGNGAKASNGANGAAGYSDGFSEELWKQPPPVAAPAPTDSAASPAPAVAPGPTAQGLALRSGGRRPMATSRSLLISSDYQPSNLWDALRAQLGFFVDSAMWYLGVADTTVMPHSAVCQIRVPDGTAEGGLNGTGFFIGPRLIMTAAHVVDGQSELIVVPGKNGGGTGGGAEPFGRFKVSSANFRKFTGYSGNGDFDRDMALICVPAANAAPSGRYFDLVEELTQSRPEGVVVSGYAAWWEANTPIEQYVNDNIDPNKQHMMGGYIRELPTDHTFTYNLQTLAGTSGSPVYWIEDGALGPQAHLVGVHVASFDEHSNRGCRITGEKLAWIRNIAAGWGQTLTFAQSVRGVRSLSVVDEDSAYDIGGPIPDEGAASNAQSWYGSRGLTLTTPEYPQANRFEAAASGNFRAVSGTRTIDKIVVHITDGGANINGTISWFKNPTAKVSSHYVIGQDGEIVQMVAHNDVAWHAGSANGTSIGIEHVANTKGLTPTAAQMCASAALVTWLCDQYGIAADRAHILGHAEADGKTTHKACPNAVWDWVYYMDMITTRTCYVPASIAPSNTTPTNTPTAQSLGRSNGHANGGSNAYGYATRSRALQDDVDHDALTDPDAMGIDGDIPDDEPQSHAQAWYARALGDPAPEYPDALSFSPAHPNNYTKGRKAGVAIDRVVVHITASKNDYDKTVKNWFQNPKQLMGKNNKRVRVSAHYIVGRGGEVVQMVAHGDTAHHANSANSRSIGIEHNATTTADHAPTDAQYRNSAKLVAWLCAELGIPADRTHVLGHSEVDPKTTHTSCPNSVWDWETYMGYLAIEAAKVAASGAVGGAVAQSLGARRGYSMAQEIITPFYDPADPMSALTCQADAFSQAREEWFAGVPNTTIFPHSAICLLEMDDGSGGIARGTGFYIGRNRILTCAHNLHGMASVAIIPGKNGNGGASTEPFGRTSVTSSSWRIPASYAGSNAATDLAVIDNVPIDAPNGQWFDTLEELNQSRPEGVVVCGYSSRSEKVPELTKAIDGFKQHLHAGYIAALASDDSTFSYPILTLKRASGSPVYYISDKSGVLSSYVVGVHTGADTDDLNRGCRLMQNKIDWIEGRTTSLSLGASRRMGSRALANDGPSDHPVSLIPQPNKDACWAASMAMLIAHRRQQSQSPESIINDIGGSLASSYGWELLNTARNHYGFEVIEQPSNASIYHTPRQWAEWLNTYGPLWVVIVGAPHAVVVAGIRGGLDDPNAARVKILNPWDTRVAFDNDPIDFHPANNGYEDWLPFMDFAAAFGDMAQPDYGNWRILHLPVAAATAQSLSTHGKGMRLASPPPSVRVLNLDAIGSRIVSIEPRREPIEPSRVLGVRMSRVIGEAGGSRWALDQLEGLKSPATLSPTVSSAAPTDVRIDINDWPAIDSASTPLPLTVEFRAANGSLGDVRITAGMPANLAYGVDVIAKIEDCADADGVARLRVRIDYRFRGLSEGSPDATIELALRGDGRYERENGWRDVNVEKPDVDKYAVLSPAA